MLKTILIVLAVLLVAAAAGVVFMMGPRNIIGRCTGVAPSSATSFPAS